MRGVLILFLVTLSLSAISQHVVKGVIHDPDGYELPMAKVIEDGTDNKTESDLDGQFELTTIQSPSFITVYGIGLDSKAIVVTSDTSVVINLEFFEYNTPWLTFGTNYELYNSVFGFQISNGVDEKTLIHYKDFQDKILVKIHGQTDFNDNYSYGTEIGLNLLRYIGRTTLKYDALNFEESELFLTDFNLTSLIRYFRNTGVIFRSGYQEFNDKENFGFGLGLEQGGQNLYLGINSRYYFDYFHHEAYLQFRISEKDFFSFRTVYNRINNHNLLSAGLNYTFLRNNNR